MSPNMQRFREARAMCDKVHDAIESTLGDYAVDDTNAQNRERQAIQLMKQAERAMGDGKYDQAIELAQEAHRTWEGN